MKKFLWCLFSFLLIISGCSFSQKEPIEMSFDDAVSIFANDMSKFYLTVNGFLRTKGTNHHIFLRTDGGNSNLNIYGSLDLSGQENSILSGELRDLVEIENNFDREILFDLYYQDKNKQNGNSFQGNLFQKKVGDKYFLKLSNGVVNLGSGNYETDFVKLLIDNLGEKWINYTPEFSKKMENFKEKGLEFLRNFQYVNLYEYMDKVTYEGDTAYKTNKGTLIVRDLDSVELKFDDLEIGYNGKTYFIKGNISGKYGKISIKDEKNSTKSIEISRQKKKQNLLLNISFVENFKTLGEADLTIKDFWVERGNIGQNPAKYKIDGYIKISPILIYGTDLENEIKINIMGSCEKSDLSGNLSIIEPDSFLLLDQILGDKFSLESILGKDNFN